MLTSIPSLHSRLQFCLCILPLLPFFNFFLSCDSSSLVDRNFSCGDATHDHKLCHVQPGQAPQPGTQVAVRPAKRTRGLQLPAAACSP